MKVDFTIGQLARAAGINVETIRYYERRSLIVQPAKPFQGYRSYPQTTLARLLFIRRAQELGFTLEEIGILLALDESPCREVQTMAEQKLVSVRAKVADLCRLESVLDGLLNQCATNPDHAHCPIIETLQPGDK